MTNHFVDKIKSDRSQTAVLTTFESELNHNSVATVSSSSMQQHKAAKFGESKRNFVRKTSATFQDDQENLRSDDCRRVQLMMMIRRNRM